VRDEVIDTVDKTMSMWVAVYAVIQAVITRCN